MTAAEIFAEQALGGALHQVALDAFAAEGVTPLALARTASGRYDSPTRDRVKFDAGRFEFARHLRDADEANFAIIFPLRDELGDLTDLLAYRPHMPPATWRGSPIAGAENILAPRLGDPLDAFETVIDWLRAGRDGIVILDPARAAVRLAGVTLRAATPKHARELRLALARPAPPIVTRQPAEQAAKRLQLARRA